MYAIRSYYAIKDGPRVAGGIGYQLEDRAYHHHNHAGLNALAGDVGDRQPDPVSAGEDNVEIIPAYALGRVKKGSETDFRQFGKPFRMQRLLDL